METNKDRTRNAYKEHVIRESDDPVELARQKDGRFPGYQDFRM